MKYVKDAAGDNTHTHTHTHTHIYIPIGSKGLYNCLTAYLSVYDSDKIDNHILQNSVQNIFVFMIVYPL
jgi:hypothetical protein